MQNRAAFHAQYSYAANRPRLVDVIEGLADAPPAMSAEFSRLIDALQGARAEAGAAG